MWTTSVNKGCRPSKPSRKGGLHADATGPFLLWRNPANRARKATKPYSASGGPKEGFHTISPYAPDAYASLLDLMTPLGLRADNVLRPRPAAFLCSVFCVRIPPRS